FVPLIRDLDLEKYRGMTTGDGTDVMDIVVEKLRTKFVSTWDGKGSNQVHIGAVMRGRLLPLENPSVDNSAVTNNDVAMGIDVDVEVQAHGQPIQTSSNSSVATSNPSVTIIPPTSTFTKKPIHRFIESSPKA
ncbi:hypothetical protein ACHAQE_011189, partial [Botrytis cinerea]